MDMAKIGLGIAGFAAGGALLYGSKFVPSKFQAIPIAGGLGAMAFGGWQIYQALYVEAAEPSGPEDAPYIKTTINSPTEGQNIGMPWWVFGNFTVYNNTGKRKSVTIDIWLDLQVAVTMSKDLDVGDNNIPFILIIGAQHVGRPAGIAVIPRDTTTGAVLNGSGAQVLVNVV